MKTGARELVKRLPGNTASQYPGGEPFVTAFAHGSISLEMYAPIAVDAQQPHLQDEIYIVHSGAETMLIGHERHSFASGTCLFMTAGVEHPFEGFSYDFATCVVFGGPEGGKS